MNAAVAAFKSNNIPYCSWGIDGDTGFLKTGSGLFPDDIDKDALEAYGFKMPDENLVAKKKASYNDFPQKPYIVFDGICGKGSYMPFGRWNTTSVKDDDAHQYCEKTLDLQDASLRIYLPKQIISKVAANRNELSQHQTPRLSRRESRREPSPTDFQSRRTSARRFRQGSPPPRTR